MIKLAYFAAGVQILFWMNMAELSYNYLRDEGQPASETKKKAMGMFCAATSLIFPFMVHFYSKRRIIRVDLEGNQVRLTNSRLLGNKVMVFERGALKCKERAMGNTGNMYLYSKRAKFLVEKEGMLNANMWDYVFFR
jgi:hypothetical protein